MTWGLETTVAQVHDDAPGLALVAAPARDGVESLSITHVSTGLNAGLISSYVGWPPCPAGLIEVMRIACGTLDYASLTLASAAAVPEEMRRLVRDQMRPLYEHACPVCAWWHAARIPKRIAELEAEVSDLRRIVRDAEDELEETRATLETAEKELEEMRERAAEMQKEATL
jgi:hypothetical protein